MLRQGDRASSVRGRLLSPEPAAEDVRAWKRLCEMSAHKASQCFLDRDVDGSRVRVHDAAPRFRLPCAPRLPDGQLESSVAALRSVGVGLLGPLARVFQPHQRAAHRRHGGSATSETPSSPCSLALRRSASLASSYTGEESGITG